MKLLVCISNVPDTTTKIVPTSDKKNIDQNGIQWIINPWDELALTRALELMEASGGTIEKVDVAGVGEASVEPTLRKALAIGANEAFRINAPASDAYFVSSQLAKLVKEKNYDIVLCGIESSDFNGNAVGGMMAEMLSYNSVASVSGVELQGTEIIVKREIDGGSEKIKCAGPVVLIVQKGIALDPRIPSMRGIMMSRTKPFQVLEADDVENLIEITEFTLPAPKSACKMIAEENAGDLIQLLHNEAKVL